MSDLTAYTLTAILAASGLSFVYWRIRRYRFRKRRPSIFTDWRDGK